MNNLFDNIGRVGVYIRVESGYSWGTYIYVYPRLVLRVGEIGNSLGLSVFFLNFRGSENFLIPFGVVYMEV